MKLAVRTVKLDVIKNQVQSLLNLDAKDIVALPTNYPGITLLNLDKNESSTLNSIRNIEAILLDETAVEELLQSTATSGALSLKSLNSVDAFEQYEHLRQLLHIQKAMKDKR